MRGDIWGQIEGVWELAMQMSGKEHPRRRAQPVQRPCAPGTVSRQVREAGSIGGSIREVPRAHRALQAVGLMVGL